MIRRNNRGETLIEVLVSLSIGFLILFLVLSTMASSRSAAIGSWSDTAEAEFAMQMMEQLKGFPYEKLLEWEQRYRVNGQAIGLNPRDDEFLFHMDERFDGIEAEFDLLMYKDVPLKDLLKIVVRAGNVEFASIRMNR